nr:hypothetical protein CFP56_41485 [Quercus suber]
MKDSDDYITKKAANPWTGLVSPSVENTSPVAPHTINAHKLISRCAQGVAGAPVEAVPYAHDAGGIADEWTSKCLLKQEASYVGSDACQRDPSKHITAEADGRKAFRDDDFVLRMPSAQEPQPFEYPGCSSEQIQEQEFMKRHNHRKNLEGVGDVRPRSTLRRSKHALGRNHNVQRCCNSARLHAQPMNALKGEGWWDDVVNHDQVRQDTNIARCIPATTRTHTTQHRTTEGRVRSITASDAVQDNTKGSIIRNVARRPLDAAPRPRSAGKNQAADHSATRGDLRGSLLTTKSLGGNGHSSFSTPAKSQAICDRVTLADVLPKVQLRRPELAAVWRHEPKQRHVEKGKCSFGYSKQDSSISFATNNPPIPHRLRAHRMGNAATHLAPTLRDSGLPGHHPSAKIQRSENVAVVRGPHTRSLDPTRRAMAVRPCGSTHSRYHLLALNVASDPSQMASRGVRSLNNAQLSSSLPRQ